MDFVAFSSIILRQHLKDNLIKTSSIRFEILTKFDQLNKNLIFFFTQKSMNRND